MQLAVGNAGGCACALRSQSIALVDAECTSAFAAGPEMPTHRILVVDDEPAQLELLSGFLRHHGFEVVEAADGFDAVACTRGGRFDLALLDQRMPRLGGIDAMQRLREIQPDLIIVLVTAFGTPDEEQRAGEAGAAAYLAKPLDLRHLRRVIDEALGTRTS